MQRYALFYDSKEDMQHISANSKGGWVRYDDAQAEIARLTAERDQALARAAAAAMDMRKRAAQECMQHLTDPADEVLSDIWMENIRALPIPTDAQKALDKLLAKAREDAIREAADIANKNRDISGWVSHDAILALLTDGGRDE